MPEAAERALSRERLLTAMLTIPTLLRHPVWHRPDPTQGRGKGVLLIPGFGVGDSSLALVHTWLAARGYRPARARIGFNIGCTTELVKRLETRLDQIADQTGDQVILMGQSRGGWLGRLIAVRRPELVRGLVMLGAPVLDPLGAHGKVVRVARFLARLSALGVPGLLNAACLTGDCMRRHREALKAALPVPAVAVYSRQDAIVPWELCMDPCAECVEVSSTHTGMALDPEFFAAVQPRLARWALGSPQTACG
ncbi:alpha/beta hydrolase [Actinokineospora sp. NPDC004072]